ncbi:uncharacterized protein LOC129952460 [Eupeodes corollae]|uniref:uncharacterized protein LOC129952460 n=1 Tax=Eupeodes corollae TaxID=290404 RepID=UPI002493BF81|nr:uncharacterized protein LOC129952460 [Eupeodes corollae]
MSSAKISANSNLKSFESCFENIILSPIQRKHFQEIGICRIGSDLLKAVNSIQPIDFKKAQDELEISNGLFGLSLKNFYERLSENENSAYIDVLLMKSEDELKHAKISIIFEDLQNLLKDLFLGYTKMNMETVLNDISNSGKLLSIGGTIINEFKNNSKHLKKIQDKLNAFNVRETNAITYANNQVYAVQNDCVETELILEPIEFRYKMAYHQRTTEQSLLKAELYESDLQKTLDHIEMSFTKDNTVSESIQLKQGRDIEILKSRLEEMTEKYNREYEILDGQISYKRNGIDFMRDQYNDCLEKLEFYKSDIGRLREWHDMWIRKEIEEAHHKLKKPTTKIQKKSKKGKKKK